MNYMLAIFEERGQRSRRSPQEGQALYQNMLGFAETLKAEGRLRGVESLLSDDRGRRVQVRDGQPRLIDGPFTEAKEMIGGYPMVEVASQEEAREVAREFMQLHLTHWPDFEGECEVRPLDE